MRGVAWSMRRKLMDFPAFLGKRERMFFSEAKNQKTFASLRRAALADVSSGRAEACGDTVDRAQQGHADRVAGIGAIAAQQLDLLTIDGVDHREAGGQAAAVLREAAGDLRAPP